MGKKAIRNKRKGPKETSPGHTLLIKIRKNLDIRLPIVLWMPNQSNLLTRMNSVKFVISQCFQIKFLIEAGHLNNAIILGGISQPLFGRTSEWSVPEEIEAAGIAMLHKHHTFARALKIKFETYLTLMFSD